MTKDELIAICKRYDLLLDDTMLEKLDAYAAYLKEYNEKINLTAITEYEEVLEKHFFDSMLPSFYVDLKGTLVDVGTGAGFPGVVLKIIKPELNVILIEPLKKRCIFLESLISKLELKDIEVINMRGEDYSLMHREAYGYVTARAVSNLNALIEVCGAMVKKDGYFLALRGASGIEEISNAEKAIKTMGFKVEEIVEEELPDSSKRIIGLLKKQRNTDKKYPRKYSIIKQRPL